MEAQYVQVSSCNIPAMWPTQLDQPVAVGPKSGPPGLAMALLGACLPIVDVPVHTVMGMPMTKGMGMPVAFIMGTQKSYMGCIMGMPVGCIMGMRAAYIIMGTKNTFPGRS